MILSQKKVKAIVPVKLNSKRVLYKNIQEINGKPIIEWTVDMLNGVDRLDDIIVYCSDEEIEKYIKSKHTFIKRDKFLDADDKNIHDIMDQLINVDNIHSDYWIIQHCTSPFIKASTINDMLDKITYEGYDSSFAAVGYPKHGWFKDKPLNFNPKNIGFTQDVKPIYIESSGPYIFKEEEFLKTRRRIGDNFYLKKVPFMEGLDIDDEEDLEIAKFIGKKYE